MTTTISLRRRLGPDKSDISGPITSLDFGYIVAPMTSLEEYVVLHYDGPEGTVVSNISFWFMNPDVLRMGDARVMYGIAGEWAEPSSELSQIATSDMGATSDTAQASWPGELSAIGDITDNLVLQIQLGATAVPGRWTKQIVFFQYTEEDVES